MKRPASVGELRSAAFRSFMSRMNAFAQAHGLRLHTDGSKVWEYPWAWQHLSRLPFPGLKILVSVLKPVDHLRYLRTLPGDDSSGEDLSS